MLPQQYSFPAGFFESRKRMLPSFKNPKSASGLFYFSLQPSSFSLFFKSAIRNGMFRNPPSAMGGASLGRNKFFPKTAQKVAKRCKKSQKVALSRNPLPAPGFFPFPTPQQWQTLQKTLLINDLRSA